MATLASEQLESLARLSRNVPRVSDWLSIMNRESAMPTGASHPVAAVRSRPRAARRPRQVVAAGLLAASAVVPVAGTMSALNGWYWGLGELDFPLVWFVLQLAVTPIGNLVSLLLADRRQLWVKLNYVVLGLWLLVAALLWLFARSVVVS
jgi:hypothetical protein